MRSLSTAVLAVRYSANNWLERFVRLICAYLRLLMCAPAPECSA